MLTGAAQDKLGTLKWDDIRDGVWYIRSEAREKGTPGVLRLPPLALRIIESAAAPADNPYVFAGPRRWGLQRLGKGEEQAGCQAAADAALDIHDLRRTARTLMSREEAGIDETLPNGFSATRRAACGRSTRGTASRARWARRWSGWPI